jgi:hypothetical protein
MQKIYCFFKSLLLWFTRRLFDVDSHSIHGFSIHARRDVHVAAPCERARIGKCFLCIDLLIFETAQNCAGVSAVEVTAPGISRTTKRLSSEAKQARQERSVTWIDTYQEIRPFGFLFAVESETDFVAPGLIERRQKGLKVVRWGSCLDTSWR